MSSAGKTVKKVVKASKKVVSADKSILHSLLPQILEKDRLMNSFRFESQENLIWTFEELHQHSQAVALGLGELGYRKGEKVGLMVERSFAAEVVALQLGCWKAGVEVVAVRPADSQHLNTILKHNNLKGLVFSPNSKTVEGRVKYSDLVGQAVPSSIGVSRGDRVNTSEYPALEHLIHTGFHTVDGCFKMRQMMVYGMKESTSWKHLDQLEHWNNDILLDNMTGEQLLDRSRRVMDRLEVTKGRTVVVAGENRSELATALGLVNALQHSNQVVVTGNLPLHQLSSVLQWYSNPLLLLEDQVLIDGQKTNVVFDKEKLGEVQVVVHSYDQHSKNKLDKQVDLQRIFKDFKVENMMSSLI